jgi:DNA polymerase-1
MIADFNHGDDIHAATASKIYKVNIDQVTSEQRRKAKSANFGIIYGISAFGLSQRLDIPRGEAKELINTYFQEYPQVKNYIDQMIENGRCKGYVETMFGRKRYLPDINSRNQVVRKVAERNCVNAPIQGTAADLIKLAMIAVHQKMKEANLKSKMVLQVHDELLVDVVADELDIVKKIVNEQMESVAHLLVPLVVDCNAANNWLEAH